MSAGITPVLVFDGAPPAEKLATIHRRRIEKMRQLRKIEWVERHVIGHEPIPTHLALALPPTRPVEPGKTFADAVRTSTTTTTTTTTPSPAEKTKSSYWYVDEHEYLPPTPEEIQDIRTNLEQHRRRASAAYLTPEHVYQTQGLCEILGIPYIQAESEAECTAAALQKRGIVSAVYTADTDTITYGASRVVRKIINYELVDQVELDFVLRELVLSYEQFVRFCVLVGCDYCDGIQQTTTYRILSLVRHPDNQGPHLFDTFRNTHGIEWVERAKRAYDIYTQDTPLEHVQYDIAPCKLMRAQDTQSLAHQLETYLGMEGIYMRRVVDQIARSFRDFTCAGYTGPSAAPAAAHPHPSPDSTPSDTRGSTA
jgi:5'-3' exonuclease